MPVLTATSWELTGNTRIGALAVGAAGRAEVMGLVALEGCDDGGVAIWPGAGWPLAA